MSKIFYSGEYRIFVKIELKGYFGIFVVVSRSSQCSTTGVTKAVVCAILSVGWLKGHFGIFLVVSHSSQCSMTGVTGCGMCYPVCEVVDITDPLVLIRKSIPCSGSSRIPFSICEWFFTICMTPYKHK